MDPNATFELIRDAVENGDNDVADYHCAVLQTWIANGGFKPTGFKSRWESDENATEHYEAFIA